MRVQSVVFVIAMVPVLAAAQQFLPAPPTSSVDPNLRFEVSSVKIADAGVNMFMRVMPGGGFESIGMPIGMLLRQALQKPDYQIVGAPGWIDTERYTILAKAPEGTPPAAMTVLLRNLLKDRFRLTTHVETREQPVFNLVMARTDGRLGPDLKATSAECQATIAERIAAAKAAAGRGGMPPLPPPVGPNDPLPCGFARMNPGFVGGSGRPLPEIVQTLSDLGRRPVIDKTGLSGMFDFTLKFAPETAGAAGPFARLPGATPPPPDPDAPNVFTAVQEQLGLKLESALGPVEVVVIDRFEKPTLD